MRKFDLKKEYNLYLQRVGLNEELLHPAQIRETRRAFCGAVGQMLVFLQELSKVSQENAISALEDTTKQVADFWMKEQIRHN